MSYSGLQKVLPDVIEAIGRMGLSDLLPFRQVQPRLNVPPNPRTGRFQRQLPGPREVPVENIPRRAQYPQAAEPELPRARPAGQAPGQIPLLMRENLTPGTTVIRRQPVSGGLVPGGAAPEPAWGRVERLRAGDPAMYNRLRSIAETTGAERNVNPDDIMQALLSPEGLDSPILRQLSSSSEIVPSRGMPPGRPPGGGAMAMTGEKPSGALTKTSGGLVEGQIDPARIYEIFAQQKALPEGSSLGNLGGVQLVDLRQALSAPGALRGASQSAEEIRQAASIGSTARGASEQVAEQLSRIPLAPVVGAGLLGGIGVGALLSQQQTSDLPGAVDQFGRVPGQTALGVPTATPDTGANLPAVEGAPNLATPQPPIGGSNAIPGTVNPSAAAPRVPLGGGAAPAAAIPGASAAARPVVSATGAGAVVQQMNDGDSNYRQAVQNAAQALRTDANQYKNIADFYKVQEAYAEAPGRAQQIIESLKASGAPQSVGIESMANFEAWAKANPELAYRLQLQTQRRAASQQMPQAQGTAVGTTMGTNFMNNAVGQSRAAAVNAAYGTQGASDLANTLAPQAYQTIQKMPLF